MGHARPGPRRRRHLAQKEAAFARAGVLIAASPREAAALLRSVLGG